MLAELRMEREQIEEAILTLERLARGRGRRRGRPPAWLKDAQAAIAEEAAKDDLSAPAPKRRGRPVGSTKAKQAAASESA
jgi:DNA invertase Pin-like site-specific DNA recombinase